MSILYEFKVVEANKIKLPIEKIIDYCYDSMEDNFRTTLKEFNMDLSEEPRKIKSERFIHLIKELANKCKIEDDCDILMKSHWYKNEQFEKLHNSVKNNKITDELFHYKILMWNNLFSEILNKEENIVDVAKLKIEVVSIHPDSGFPKYRYNSKMTKNDERRFLIRLLSSIESGCISKNPIEKWFNEKELTSNKEAGLYQEEILWGFLREKRSIKIKPNSKTFWKKHQDKWWNGLEEHFDGPSDNKPYEVVTYEVIIHPAWFKNLNEIINIYESTAHWMS